MIRGREIRCRGGVDRRAFEEPPPYLPSSERRYPGLWFRCNFNQMI